mmetsp:Transcript_8857/g.9970  ORF Transcript_8857/g.9970 Transcript_8857/m.9970 type:complete len:334 (+) Transcript_8857:34-1035(+)
MQTLSHSLQYLGLGRNFALSKSPKEYKKLQSLSFDALTTHLNPIDTKEPSPTNKKATHRSTICDLRFSNMASDAARVDTRNKLIEEFKFDADVFRPDSPESTFLVDLPYQRTDIEARKEYIERLTYMKLIRHDHVKPHQTLIIFDWDDTILPTSYLCYIGLEKVTPAIARKLEMLDRSVVKLLSKAAKVGKVCIVTNAMESWVETSSKMYLPLTCKLLEGKDIPIVSARAEYGEMYPDDPKRWKADTFLDIARSFDTTILTNILCFGDSEIEMEAASNMSKSFKQAVLKTVKFKQSPQVEELTKQIEVILGKFDQIFTTLKTLTIKLEKKTSE